MFRPQFSRHADVVIIGGSLAGAACARQLAHHGIDVQCFERDIFPRPKVCGGFLSPGAVDCLDRLGLLDQVVKAGAVTVDHARITVRGARFEFPFPRNGMGISRYALDHVVAQNAPVAQGVNVRDAAACRGGFLVTTEKGCVNTPILIDAAGKLSRFSRRASAPEFGIQYTESSTRGSALDFWFFEDGYGGAISVEGDRSNFSFLVRKPALGRYLARPGRLVTGPLGYDRPPAGVLTIGDAGGMIDPFCGEGMHQALDSGMIAAEAVVRGLRAGQSYGAIRQAYELEWARRWAKKRMLAGAMRRGLAVPAAFRLGVGWMAGWLLKQLWATIPA